MREVFKLTLLPSGLTHLCNLKIDSNVCICSMPYLISTVSKTCSIRVMLADWSLTIYCLGLIICVCLLYYLRTDIQNMLTIWVPMSSV